MTLTRTSIIVVAGLLLSIGAGRNWGPLRKLSDLTRERQFGVEFESDGISWRINATRSSLRLDGTFDVDIDATFDAIGHLKAMTLFGGADRDGDGWIRRNEWRVLGVAEIAEDAQANEARSVQKLRRLRFGASCTTDRARSGTEVLGFRPRAGRMVALSSARRR